MSNELSNKKWIKKGKIFKNNSDNEYLKSHSSNPLAIHLQDDVYRIFYNSRNKKNASSVAYFDFDILNNVIVNSDLLPKFKFDFLNNTNSGISLGENIVFNSKNYIGTMIWYIEEGKHWYGKIGKLELDGNYEIVQNKDNYILLDLDGENPISLSYPSFYEFESKIFMIYGSTLDWNVDGEDMIHVLKISSSTNFKDWKFEQTLPYELGKFQAFSRPSVYVDKIDSSIHLWFSYREGTGDKYKIGYGNFSDSQWKLYSDKYTLEVSENGWDSEMVEYPNVFNHKDKLYMLYNGNSYGETGIGLAVLE